VRAQVDGRILPAREDVARLPELVPSKLAQLNFRVLAGTLPGPTQVPKQMSADPALLDARILPEVPS
jgi:hypothetical protein